MDEDTRQWVVSVHTCGGSMSEAVTSLIVIGPYDEAVAKAVEVEFHKRLEAIFKPGSYETDNLWAIAEPLERIPGTIATNIVDGLLNYKSLRNYAEVDD